MPGTDCSTLEKLQNQAQPGRVALGSAEKKSSESRDDAVQQAIEDKRSLENSRKQGHY
jgi:hypothetical protein